MPSLSAFASYVPYGFWRLRASRALSKRLACLIHAPCGPYLCALKPFQDGLLVKETLSIFQGLTKALQTMLFLRGSKNSRETF